MHVIGITGGIGSGKSEILRYLNKTYNCKVLLSDDVAKEMEKPGGALYEPLIELLRSACREDEERELLSPDGSLNKAIVAGLIFSDRGLLQRVNALIHPAVRQQILDEIEIERQLGAIEFFIVESALLSEGGLIQYMDSIWYIYCDDEVRRIRLKASRGYSDEKIDSIMNKQQSEEIYRQNCHFVINNSADLQDALRQVDNAIRKVREME